MVGLGPSGYDNGLAAVAMVLRWLDCGGEGTIMVGLGRSGYYDGWTAVVRVLRRFFLRWRWYYYGWAKLY